MGDALGKLDEALGAELLRADLLGAPRPRVAERYEVRRVIGRGARGLVVEAFDGRLERTVALKLSVAEGQGEEALGEARALAQLDHPNVVRVHDVDLVSIPIDGTPFRLTLVAMTHVPGKTVRAWLAEEKRGLQQILTTFAAAGHGLAAAHDAKIVHRDFKPDNVLIGQDGVVRVADFGFAIPAASFYGAPADQADLAGTAPYLAPEAWRGATTRRSDQFSFGVSLVEALTGDPVPAGTEPPKDVPSEVWSALQRATHREPGERFHSMHDVVNVLEREAMVIDLSEKIERKFRGFVRLLVIAATVATACYLAFRAVTSRGPEVETITTATPGYRPLDLDPCEIPTCQPAGNARTVSEAGFRLVDRDPAQAACLSVHAAIRAETERDVFVLGAAYFNLGRAMAKRGCPEMAYRAYRTSLCKRPEWPRNPSVIGIVKRACQDLYLGTCDSSCREPLWYP